MAVFHFLWKHHEAWVKGFTWASLHVFFLPVSLLFVDKGRGKRQRINSDVADILVSHLLPLCVCVKCQTLFLFSHGDETLRDSGFAGGCWSCLFFDACLFRAYIFFIAYHLLSFPISVGPKQHLSPTFLMLGCLDFSIFLGKFAKNATNSQASGFSQCLNKHLKGYPRIWYKGCLGIFLCRCGLEKRGEGAGLGESAVSAARCYIIHNTIQVSLALSL